MSNFDPDAFLSTTVSGPSPTHFEPIPEGDYTAIIEKVSPRIAGDYAFLDASWILDDPQLMEKLGRRSLRVRQSIFLDLTPQGSLDTSANKNVALGRLREAVGQNGKGKWALSNLNGAGPATVKVTHRTNEETGTIYEEIKRVTAS